MNEFIYFLKKRKKLWLFPLLATLILVGGLLFVASSGSVVAPFIYTLF